MPKKRSWTDQQLIIAVESSLSFRSVLIKLGLVPAGGNYAQVQRITRELAISTTHFSGKGWNKGMTYHTSIRPSLDKILTTSSTVQSYKLKKRLFEEKLKIPMCEICGWAQLSADGRIPVELDHINGDHSDNRLINLRILCPNCHSLQSTHRGKNKRVHSARVV